MITNSFRIGVGLSTIAIALVGCGPSELPYTDNSKDSAAFARDIKQIILNSAEDIVRSPQPADTIRVIVQSLSELDACPTGDNLKTYEQLHKLAADLLQQSEKGKSADLAGKVNEIVDLANTLPGEVTIVKEKGRD